MKSKSPAFQFYPDKWQTDTRRLSWEAKGVFHELMCVVWIQFQITCCFPDDDVFISGEIGCSLEVWKRTKAELLNPYRPIIEKTETNSFLIRGLLKEAEKQEDRREKLRKNGMLGGRPKKQKVIFEEPKHKPGSGNQNESLPSPTPSPTPYPEATDSPFVIPENLKSKQFEEIWSKWLEHLNQKRKTPTILAAEMQLKKLADIGKDRAIKALEHSIAGNYQAVYEPSDSKPNGQQPYKRDWNKPDIRESL